MSKLLSPTQVKFFYSILFDENTFEISKILNLLNLNLESSESFYPEFNPLQDYYSKEMGPNLKRVIIVNSKLSERDELVPKKLWATETEIKYSRQDETRTINIDVGYIAKEQVILSTGKPYSHRIYLGSSVFCELVYTFQNKTFHKVPWTYPDYQHQEKIEFFNSVR